MSPAAAGAATSERNVLLATKLNVPGLRPDLVSRPRLAQRLEESRGRGLVLVCAPAGYGKSVLLAEWARRGPHPVAWLSLDAGDNDPARFWRHTVAALDRVRPGISERMGPLLGPPPPPSFEPLVTALINEVADQPDADEALLLILDDYHLISSRLVHEPLGFLLEHRPPGLHLALTSRSDPPLALARLRARGQLTELRAADLRFTPGEAAALLQQVAAVPGAAPPGAPLPDAVAAALAARTEGWAAGLQLAALSLRGQDDIALTTLNTGRLALPAGCAATGKLALKMAREWSRERVQWGRPVGEHEEVAVKISFIAATTYALEAMVELSSQLADDKRNDFRIEAALAKLWCSEMASTIADELVQIRGGRGYETAASLAARGERGVPAEQMLRDMRINRIFEGSSEIMRLFIAREAVDAHLSAAGDLIDPQVPIAQRTRAAGRAGGFYARWLPTLVTGDGQKPRAYSDFGPLATHLRYVERASRKLARVTFYGMARWQGRLEHKQRFLGRIVDIGAELFAISAACVRAQHDMAAATGTGRDATAAELAGLFCTQARLRAEELFGQLWRNTDSPDAALARHVLSGRYLWLEDGVIDPSIPGPLIAEAEPGPAKTENVHRRII